MDVAEFAIAFGNHAVDHSEYPDAHVDGHGLALKVLDFHAFSGDGKQGPESLNAHCCCDFLERRIGNY
jgi:hypothetical protein